MRKMLSGFRAFAMKGNVVDLAVGGVIGDPLGMTACSLVNDVSMPLISL